MRTAIDDMGATVTLPGAAQRVVSLVPSLTESVALTRRESLIGATDWCTHPSDLAVARIRGTKNPDVAAIIALQPDVVLANKEENRRLDVERLRAAGISVWVTVIETVDQSLQSLRRMFQECLGWEVPDWLIEAESVWLEPLTSAPARAVIPVWRDPWIVVGSSTFTGDLAARLGLLNVYQGHAERYPHVALEELQASVPDLLVLPDEPYLFTSADGPEAFPGTPCRLVDGRALTWYGPSLVTARDLLTHQLSRPTSR
jgi:ABC-type Fe3+-hydroxamate transport system substrate-binding protein